MKSTLLNPMLVATLSLSFLIRCLDGRTFLVPKNLPANQSSQLTIAQTANLAYNGNTDGIMVDYLQCTGTGANDPAPWWMLDLQQTYLIASVRVWNRLSNSDEVRFTQISLEISSDPSVWSVFDIGLFHRCTVYTLIPTDAMNPISLVCPSATTGRYLALYKNRTGLTDPTQAYFNFCEVDVFAVTVDNNPLELIATEIVQPSFLPSSTSLQLPASTKTRSESDCIVRCSMQPSCLFVVVHVSSKDCWLLGSSSLPKSFTGLINSGDAKFVGLYNYG